MQEEPAATSAAKKERRSIAALGDGICLAIGARELRGYSF